jgi:hypothetical protein
MNEQILQTEKNTFLHTLPDASHPQELKVHRVVFKEKTAMLLCAFFDLFTV